MRLKLYIYSMTENQLESLDVKYVIKVGIPQVHNMCLIITVSITTNIYCMFSSESDIMLPRYKQLYPVSWKLQSLVLT